MSNPIFARLNEDLHCKIFSYLPLESASGINKSTERFLKFLRLREHYPRIMAFPQGTLVRNIADRYPLIESEDGKNELVKRVRATFKQVIPNMYRNTPQYWNELGLPSSCHILDLSYLEMHNAYFYPQDKVLVPAFERIMASYPAIRNSIQGNSETQLLENTSQTEKAYKIGNWLVDPATRALRATIREIPLADLPGIPHEFLYLPSINPLHLISYAVAQSQTDLIQCLIDQNEERFLSHAFVVAAVEGNQQIMNMIMQSNISLDIMPAALQFINDPQIVRRLIESNSIDRRLDMSWIIKTKLQQKQSNIARIIFEFAPPTHQSDLAAIYLTALSDGALNLAWHLFKRISWYLKPLLAFSSIFCLPWFLIKTTVQFCWAVIQTIVRALLTLVQILKKRS